MPTGVDLGTDKQIAAWGADLHSHTWFLLSEFGEEVPDFAQSFIAWVTSLRSEHRLHHFRPEEVRLIIAFDN